jgi:hypothetical protein
MTTYIKLSTLEYPRHPGDVEIDPIGSSDFAEVNWVEPPQIDSERQTLEVGSPTNNSGVWTTNWVVSAIPDSVLASKVRENRNTLLVSSDWTQLADAPVNKELWATYRQALRDVSAQEGFPNNITWPEKPE